MPSQLRLLPLALLLACGPHPAAEGVIVLDSVRVQVLYGEPWVYRIQATSKAGTVIADVLRPLPILVSDTVLRGIRLGDVDSVRYLFATSLPSGAQTTYPMPEDVWPFFNDVAVSPNGQFLAYVGWIDGHPLARVRPWTGSDPGLSGPLAVGCECDVDRNHARWVSPDSFEIWVDGATDSGSGMLVRGNVTRSTFRVDTLSRAPVFH